MLSRYDPNSNSSKKVNSNGMWKRLIYMFCFSILIVNWQKNNQDIFKQNLLYFSGLCVGKKNSTNLNDLRISMTKKTSNTYLPGLLHEKLSFLIGTALIQRDAAVWMLESALKTYKPEASIFPQCLHKVLFMVASEEFWRVDGECNFICLFPSSKIPLGIPPQSDKGKFWCNFDTDIIHHPFRLRPVQ